MFSLLCSFGVYYHHTQHTGIDTELSQKDIPSCVDQYAHQGCEWQGELNDIDAHLDGCLHCLRVSIALINVVK